MSISFTRLLLLISTATLAFHAQAGTAANASTEWWSVVSDVKVGQSEEQVRKTMDRYKERSWSSLSNLFARRLNFLSGQKVAVWFVDASTLHTEGGESYVIGVFSDDKKLTDLLHFRAALHLRPILRGTYAQRLESIKKGTNVDDLYRLLGEEMPYQYYRDKTGRWLVHFSYQGVGPDFWIYEADAASGTIVIVHVSAI